MVFTMRREVDVRRVTALLVVALLGVLGFTGCTSSGRSGTDFGARPVSPECRGDVADPEPGDVICFTGELDDPIVYSVLMPRWGAARA